MQPGYLPATTTDSSGWLQTVMAFLAEKERRSGSHRTVEGYARSFRVAGAVLRYSAGGRDTPYLAR
jgi:hypothetical protein